jgi:DNA uptake protein ComE-like DNA-binding protein
LHSATKLAGLIRSKPRKQQQIWSRDKQLDLNTARKDQLLSLPGATAAEADRVIVGRPYNEPGEVVTRRILPKTEYDKIADRVTAKK